MFDNQRTLLFIILLFADSTNIRVTRSEQQQDKLQSREIMETQAKTEVNTLGAISAADNPIISWNSTNVHSTQLDEMLIKYGIGNTSRKNTSAGIADINHLKIRNSSFLQCDSFESTHGNSVLLLRPDYTNCTNFFELCSKNSEDLQQEFYDHPNIPSDLKRSKSCSTEQIFDSIDLKCVNQSEGYCGIYKCMHPDGFYPDPRSSRKFIHCFDGKPKRRLCEPTGTVFDNELKMCVRLEEELPMTLQIFKAFLWLVNSSSGPDDMKGKDGRIHSFEDYFIIVLTAITVVLGYLVIVVGFFSELMTFQQDDINPLDDTDDFYRYSSTPHLPLSRRFSEEDATSITGINNIHYASSRI